MIADKIIARLAKGAATFSQLRASIPHGFRELDRELQKLRRRGVIESIPRKKGERPQALWSLRERSERLNAAPADPLRES